MALEQMAGNGTDLPIERLIARWRAPEAAASDDGTGRGLAIAARQLEAWLRDHRPEPRTAQVWPQDGDGVVAAVTPAQHQVLAMLAESFSGQPSSLAGAWEIIRSTILTVQQPSLLATPATAEDEELPAHEYYPDWPVDRVIAVFRNLRDSIRDCPEAEDEATRIKREQAVADMGFAILMIESTRDMAPPLPPPPRIREALLAEAMVRRQIADKRGQAAAIEAEASAMEEALRWGHEGDGGRRPSGTAGSEEEP